MFRPFPVLRLCLAALMLAGPLHAAGDPEAAAMARALDAMQKQDWTAAEAAARDGGPLARDVVDWTRLRAGDGSFDDYSTFLARHPDWPGLDWLQRRGEAAITPQVTPAQVVAYFGHRRPATAKGSLALQASLLRMGRTQEAQTEARRAWVELSYSADDQAAELELMGAQVTPLNPLRMSQLLWDGKLTEAEQMMPQVSEGQQALAKARIALQRQDYGVDALVDAVPKSLQGDAGLAHDRFAYRYAKGYADRAEDLLLERSDSTKSLGEPGAWAAARVALARQEMVAGHAGRAYKIAATSHLTEGARFAELEFLAGYIALDKLREPKLALAHFRRLRAGVNSPISLSRAAYWEGRAEQALGNPAQAHAAWSYGAEFQTAFYGLLSSEKIGLTLDTSRLGPERFPDWHQAKFLSSSVLQAALLLQKAGDRRLAKRFFLQVAEGQGATGLGQLADLALARKEPNIAVLIAKQAASRGIILPRAYFPVTALASAKLPVPTDLALAIARRESEFDETVISPAGARGLMQVMPATARKMSEKAGIDYDMDRLTTDAAYNARLGSTYLAQLIDQFGPALTLVAAGYNAGPNRASTWIAQLGDPRAKGVDPVDWIESVPYSETRDYIMRVSESYEIYRAKLAGKPVKVRLTEELKGE